MTWRGLTKPWHDTTVDYCDVCGNLLIRRYWEIVDEDGSILRTCRESDQALLVRLRSARRPSAAALTPDAITRPAGGEDGADR